MESNGVPLGPLPSRDQIQQVWTTSELAVRQHHCQQVCLQKDHLEEYQQGSERQVADATKTLTSVLPLNKHLVCQQGRVMKV
jgi:hypothetical protein